MEKMLQSQLNLELENLDQILQQIDWNDPWQYGTWLWQTYYFVCHSTRLLALAASRFKVAEASLHSRFLSHASEEKGHEILALKDYQSLKTRYGELPEKMAELKSTQLFYQSQYYWIEHQDPSSFFGYILILEAMASTFGKRIHQTVSETFGENCSRFLKVHAEEDPDHIKKALSSIARLPGDSIPLVLENLILSSEAYAGICRSISAIQRPQLKLVA